MVWLSLLAQGFWRERNICPIRRPSIGPGTGFMMDPSSGGSDLGPTSQILIDQIKEM